MCSLHTHTRKVDQLENTLVGPPFWCREHISKRRHRIVELICSLHTHTQKVDQLEKLLTSTEQEERMLKKQLKKVKK